jgi:glyoxylase-like metal-dependent hydrolase (beta-lactamase superfamily II)
MTYKLKHFSAPRGCQSYLLIDRDSRKAALIDPSVEILDEYTAFLDVEEIHLEYLLETHTHADHVSASPQLKGQYEAKLVMHVDSPSSRKDMSVVSGDVIEIGSTPITVMHTPGHTNESVSYSVDGALFTGDTLLLSGTGRTDFQLGDSTSLFESLQQLLTFGDDVMVYPGHEYKGREPMSLGEIRSINDRIGMNRDDFIAHMENHHPDKPELFDISLAKNSK